MFYRDPGVKKTSSQAQMRRDSWEKREGIGLGGPIWQIHLLRGTWAPCSPLHPAAPPTMFLSEFLCWSVMGFWKTLTDREEQPCFLRVWGAAACCRAWSSGCICGRKCSFCWLDSVVLLGQESCIQGSSGRAWFHPAMCDIIFMQKCVLRFQE